MPMLLTKMNNGFYKLGDDEYRVEAPVHEDSEYALEDFVDAKGKPQQRYITVKSGKKLRTRIGREDEVEPTRWHLYKMTKFVRDGVDKVGLEILDKDFVGSAAEAIAACEAHKAGG